jgi:hypothetical protein
VGVPNLCEIFDASFADGLTNPANVCQTCNYQADPFVWTALADGTPCPQGICIQQLCQPGCVIDGTAVPEGTDPGDRCRACVPGSSPMAWVYSPDKTPCRPDGGAGAFCVSGVCNGCLAATEVCTNGGDCCSRLCDGQRCFDQSLGGICEDDRSCTPGDRCQDGYCCTSASNQTCADDRSCCRPIHCTAMGTIGGTCQ